MTDPKTPRQRPARPPRKTRAVRHAAAQSEPIPQFATLHLDRDDQNNVVVSACDEDGKIITYGALDPGVAKSVLMKIGNRMAIVHGTFFTALPPAKPEGGGS